MLFAARAEFDFTAGLRTCLAFTDTFLAADTRLFDTAIPGDFCLDFLKLDPSQIEVQSDPKREVKLLEIFERKIERQTSNISRKQIQSTINIPAEYYLGRGYSEETLETFDIGTCFAKNKPMSGRVVVPIYDEDYKIYLKDRVSSSILLSPCTSSEIESKIREFENDKSSDLFCVGTILSKSLKTRKMLATHTYENQT